MFRSVKLILLLSIISLAATCPPRPPVPPTPPVPPEPTSFAARVTVVDKNRHRIPDLVPTLTVWGEESIDCEYEGDSVRVRCDVPKAWLGWGFNYLFQAHGWVTRAFSGPNVGPELGEVLLEKVPDHFDPSFIPRERIAAIRGAMWSVRWDGPLGPRPGQPDNILATDFLNCYDVDTQNRMLDIYKSRGYTHAVIGPLVDPGAYHGQFCPIDYRNNWDGFLDILQRMWDKGITPVVFIHPDNWTFEQTRDTFTSFLQQPRSQQLIRAVVPSGWEPTKYDWSSCTWTLYVKWARETLPDALVLIHTVSDVDAPVGTDALCDDNGHSNGDGWKRVLPYLHGWLIQNGPYDQSPGQNPQLAREFGAQFKVTGDGADFHSIGWHIKAGGAGWPVNSAWGAGVPIRLYNAENTAYNSYWHNLPESTSQDWGDLALASGADGYLDGGRAEVPVH